MQKTTMTTCTIIGNRRVLHIHSLLVKTSDDAIPHRGVPATTLTDAGAPLGVCVGSEHVLGSLWALTIVVEGVVAFYVQGDAPVGKPYENGLLNLGGDRVYVAQDRIAPMPCLS